MPLERRFSLTKSRGTLAQLYSARENGIGVLRLLLAVGVIFSHSKPLGFGQPDLGYDLFARQTHVGALSVYGFFVLSGLLITRSARRTPIVRYAWHRALRIMPALWVCLLFTALIVAPLVALREHGNLADFWSGPAGPLHYLRANWWTGMRQYGIHDLLVSSTPLGRLTHSSVFDGALWSLAYETACYATIGVLALTGVLNRSRGFMLCIALALYGLILHDFWLAHSWTANPLTARYGTVRFRLVGDLDLRWIVYLGFLFVVGAVAELYRERIPIHDGLGILSAVIFAVTLLFGGLFLGGMLAYAYLLVWLAIRMPSRWHRVGRQNDYSYGIYIYGYLGQQILACLGWNRWGYLPFALVSLATAVGAAFVSWHLVEKHALAFKGWSPRSGWLRLHPSPPADEAASETRGTSLAGGVRPADRDAVATTVSADVVCSEATSPSSSSR